MKMVRTNIWVEGIIFLHLWLLIYGQNLVIPAIVVLCELFFCWFFIFAFLLGCVGSLSSRQ